MSDVYRIVVKGHLDSERSNWLGELAITQNENGESTLAGRIADQAALYGVLATLRDLGLTLLSLNVQR